MSKLESTAQELVVIDPTSIQNNDEGMTALPIEPLEVFSPTPSNEEAYQHKLNSKDLETSNDLEVNDEVSPEIEIVISDLPGAPKGTKDPEEEKPLEVVDESDVKDDKESKGKEDKWDLLAEGPDNFIVSIQKRIDKIPTHSGYDISGLSRALSYMEKLDDDISSSMRSDLEGNLDANKVEKIRATIEDGICKLHDRIEKLKKKTKAKRRKKSDYEESGLIKQAQKITGVQGTFITVPLLISGIARVCVNGVVSAGHDLEVLYKEQTDKYKLNDREKSEVRWLLYDMGYAMRGDRGFMPEEDFDQTSSDNADYSSQTNS